jgi:hypothetical protein
LHSFLPEMFTHVGEDGRSLLDQGAEQIRLLPTEQRLTLMEGYRHAIRATFLAGGCLTALGFVLAIFVPSIPLASAPPKDAPPPPADMGVVD